MFPFNYVFSKPFHIIGVEFHKECYVGVCSMPWFQEVVLRTNIMQFGRYLPCTYFVGFHENSCSLHSLSLNNVFHMQWKELSTFTTTKKGHIAIQISSQTTKKSDSENPQFRTRFRRKLLSLCETHTFAPVQSQALRNSRN